MFLTPTPQKASRSYPYRSLQLLRLLRSRCNIPPLFKEGDPELYCALQRYSEFFIKGEKGNKWMKTQVNAIQFRKMFVKHLNKICTACEGHIISMNFPRRYWEGNYA
jgi:hypothetical protein